MYLGDGQLGEKNQEDLVWKSGQPLDISSTTDNTVSTSGL